MLTVVSTPLELRGLTTKQSKSGKVYYLINAENPDGSPCSLYCPSVEALPTGLDKGDGIIVTFHVTYFNGMEKLSVCKVEKVN